MMPPSPSKETDSPPQHYATPDPDLQYKRSTMIVILLRRIDQLTCKVIPGECCSMNEHKHLVDRVYAVLEKRD